MAEQEAAQPQGAGAIVEVDELDALLNKEFKPRTEDAGKEVSSAVRTLAAQALAKAEKEGQVMSGAVVATIKQMIAEIDAKLTAQINEILHHAEFQKLEGAWRGLHYLVKETETGTDLKIRVMAVSKDELGDELAKYPGTDWDQSPLFKKLYENAYGVLGGEPYGAIVGDYHFDHSGPDVDLLGDMAKIAAACHAPFITGASAGLFDIDDWADINARKDLATLFESPPYMEWNALRERDDARYIGLAAPRFLSRRPYGANNPVDAFAFEEETGGDDSSKFTWANAAYAMAANINRAYKLYGWCSRIRGVESGGMVQNLPTHTFQTEKGAWGSQCPTEVSIPDRREAELANLGLMPLIYKQGSNEAAFIGAQSLHKPPQFDDSPQGQTATKNAMLGARLPYIFACSRFAHFLKHMVRNKIGSYMEKEDMRKWLNSWILNYVEASDNASEVAKAKRPLKAAEVVVDEDPENPGMYSAKFFLRPHYQLEGANISLRLVSKLPSEG